MHAPPDTKRLMAQSFSRGSSCSPLPILLPHVLRRVAGVAIGRLRCGAGSPACRKDKRLAGRLQATPALFATPSVAGGWPAHHLLVLGALIAFLCPAVHVWAAAERTTPLPNVQRLAFLPLDTTSDKPAHDWMRTAFPELVAARVSSCPAVHVIDNLEAARALIGSAHEAPGRVTDGLAFAVARRLYADIVVWGQLEKSGDTLSAHLVWTQGGDGHVLARRTLSGTFDAPWDLLNDMERAVLDVAGCTSPTGTSDDVSSQPARDRYTVVLLGRALASWYGLRGDTDVDRVRDTLDRALRIDPNNPVLLGVQARWLFDQGDMDGAAHAAFQAIDVMPEYVPPRRVLAAIFAQKAAVDQAVAQLEAILDVDPGDVRSRLTLANVLADSGDTAAARQHLDLVLGAKLQDRVAVEAYRLEGRLAALSGDRASAVVAFQQVLDLDPSDVDAARYLAACYLARSDFDAAEKASRHFARLAPNNPLAPHLTGEIALIDGDGASAVTAFRDEVALDPSRASAWAYLAEACRRTGDTEGQARALEALVVLAPDDPVPLNDLAVLRYQNGDLEGAAELLERATELAPGWGLLFQNLGVVVAAQGESAQAFELLLTAVHLDPGLPSAQYHLGVLLASRGDLEGAATAFRAAATSAHRDNHIPKTAGGQLRPWGQSAQASIADGQSDALRASALFNLGVVSLRLGRNADAADAFSRYLDQVPDAEDATRVRQWISHLVIRGPVSGGRGPGGAPVP